MNPKRARTSSIRPKGSGKRELKRSVRVVFVASEMVPFAKTGGLADVAGALPDALAREGADVQCFIPGYRSVLERFGPLKEALPGFSVPLGKDRLSVSVLEARTDSGTPVFVVQREDLFDRPNLYGTSGEDYYDNLERFTVFSHAVLHATAAMGFAPHILHCHDWQTGLIPPLLQGPYAGSRGLKDAASVFTVHNLGYQGLFSTDKLALTGLDRERFFHVEGLEYWRAISLLKAGLVYADAVTTVSPAYAREIQTPELGMGMEGVLVKRRNVLHGILNGADYDRWNPGTDPFLPASYGPGSLVGKEHCKAALIQEMGLGPDCAERPIAAVISRLDTQKGLDWIVEILEDILALDVALVILGTGNDRIEADLREAEKRAGKRMALRLLFDEALAHRIMAGADLFLMPSRYEPCGLTQMYALKYGTIPVVRATGGLEDTVTAYDPRSGKGTGFKFSPVDASALLGAVRDAVRLYEDRDAWKAVQKAGMEADFSWAQSARAYLEVYGEAVKARQTARSLRTPKGGGDK
jgi:starch synthase